ncbi:hypothetical protein [Flectobacillus major]|jgi:hypothetical protein|uniref:hypothetical protein n=1 Tax=Flectobacillus major TaxID=103 RepID=UPI00041629C0|nr:hypothetical protein [Flectobacillus major]
MDLQNWTIMRFIRLAVGVWALANGVIQKDFLLLGLSAVVLFQAITNTGCGGACAVPIKKKQENKPQDTVAFEEVK